jgi:hypothetical protein
MAKQVCPCATEEQRDRVHPTSRRRVLDQFDEVAAVDHGAWGRGHVHADLEARAVDLRGPTAVVPHVVRKVLDAADQALAARLERTTQHRRVARHRVGRREGVHQERRHETRLGLLGAFESGGVEQLRDELAGQEVLLGQPEVERVVRVRRVGETPVALRRRDRSRDIEPERAANRCSGGSREAEQQSGVGRGHARRIADERRARGHQRPEEGHRVRTGGWILGHPQQLEQASWSLLALAGWAGHAGLLGWARSRQACSALAST